MNAHTHTPAAFEGENSSSKNRKWGNCKIGGVCDTARMRHRYKMRRRRKPNAHIRKFSISFSHENRSLCVESQSIYSFSVAGNCQRSADSSNFFIFFSLRRLFQVDFRYLCVCRSVFWTGVLVNEFFNRMAFFLKFTQNA